MSDHKGLTILSVVMCIVHNTHIAVCSTISRPPRLVKMKTQFLLSHTSLFSPVPSPWKPRFCEVDSSVSSCWGNWCFTGLCYLAWCHQGPPRGALSQNSRGALSQNSLPFWGCITGHCVYRPCFLSPSVYQQALRLPSITVSMDISLQIFLKSCFQIFWPYSQQ